MALAEVIQELPCVVIPTHLKRAYRAIQSDYEGQCATQQHLNTASAPLGPVRDWMQNSHVDARRIQVNESRT
eukprot:7666362-Karenia_brevis.AAC.1